MAHGVGDAAFPQLELWPRPHRSEDLSLRCLDSSGREHELDPAQLARGIAAAGAPGDRLDADTALSLARAAVAHLRHSGEPEPFTHPVVVNTVERTLREMGLGRSARLYLRNQESDSDALPAAAPSGHARWNCLLDAHDAARHAAYWLRRAYSGNDVAPELDTAVGHALEKLDAEPATPGLVRELVLAELLRRGLREHAERIAGVAIPIGDIESFHRGEAGSEDAPAERILAAYAFARVYPKRVAVAHARGDIALGPFADLHKLERISLDLGGAAAPLLPDEDDDPSPLTDPTQLARRISRWTRALAPVTSRAITWRTVNFGYAPLLDALDKGEFVRAAYALFFETAAAESRSARPRTALEFSWDAPESAPPIIHSADGAPARVHDLYPAARGFFAAALEALAGLAERPTPIRFPRVVLRLSPYFFGAPEAAALLDRIARIVSNGFPLVLRHEPASPLALASDDSAPHARLVVQTVTVRLYDLLDRAPNLNALLAAAERATDDAVAAHLARHEFIIELARHRAGSLAPLRELYASRPLFDAAALRYRVAVDSGDTDPADADRAIDAVLDRMRLVCARWAESTGRTIEFTDTEPANGTGPSADPRAELSFRAEFHDRFAEPAPVFIERGPELESPAQIAEFVHWAFLYTPCRALRIR